MDLLITLTVIHYNNIREQLVCRTLWKNSSRGFPYRISRLMVGSRTILTINSVFPIALIWDKKLEDMNTVVSNIAAEVERVDIENITHTSNGNSVHFSFEVAPSFSLEEEVSYNESQVFTDTNNSWKFSGNIGKLVICVSPPKTATATVQCGLSQLS